MFELHKENIEFRKKLYDLGEEYKTLSQRDAKNVVDRNKDLREAALKLNNYRLVYCNLYVTLEPCLMCLGALVHARIGRLVYGADDPKSGAVKSHQELLNSSMLNHKFEVTSGVMRDEASEQISNFFKKKRIKN